MFINESENSDKKSKQERADKIILNKFEKENVFTKFISMD